MSHIWKSHVSYEIRVNHELNESCLTYEGVMSHVKYEWAMSHNMATSSLYKYLDVTLSYVTLSYVRYDPWVTSTVRRRFHCRSIWTASHLHGWPRSSGFNTQKSLEIGQKSPTICQKSLTIHQGTASHLYGRPRSSGISTQKSPQIEQKSPTISEKSLTIRQWTVSHMHCQALFTCCRALLLYLMALLGADTW